jgi:hypothetical protein
MEIVPYSTTHREAVDRMNAKLSRAGSEFRFEAEERPADAEQLPVWIERFIAVQDEEAYGGYFLKHQCFFMRGRPLQLGNLQLPLSLGEVDSAFSHIAAALLIDVIRRSPYCYALGLGSKETQIAKLLAAAGWRSMVVPFYFSVKSGNRFARNIRLPSERPWLQLALSVLGHLRLAGPALRLRQSRRSSSWSDSARETSDRVREVPHLDGLASELFAEQADSYELVGDRRAEALKCLYPEGEARFIRLAVERDGRAIGWAVVLDTRMQDDKYFGDLRVGSLVDCFAAPSDASAVVAAADDFLTERGVDLVVSNQLHPSWREALERVGYLEGPSNFFLYLSEAVAEELARVSGWEQGVHMNRGDGDGPENL